MEEILHIASERPIFMMGCFLFGMGLILNIIGGIKYRWRAFINKKAWGAGTGKIIMLGILFVIVGLSVLIVDSMTRGQI